MKKINKRNRIIFIFSFIVLLSFLFIVLGNIGSKTLYPIKYEDEIKKYCKEYNVDETLMLAIIKTESNFQSDAVSSVGALGLTQMLPETFDWLQSKTGDDLPDEALFNSEISIRYGTMLVGFLLEEFDGNIETAAAAYHAGIGIVSEWLEDPDLSSDGVTLKDIPYDDTKYYVETIKSTLDIYRKLYEK